MLVVLATCFENLGHTKRGQHVFGQKLVSHITKLEYNELVEVLKSSVAISCAPTELTKQTKLQTKNTPYNAST